MKKNILFRFFGPVLPAALFLVALAALHHQLKTYHYRDIVKAAAGIPAGRLLTAAALTVIAYLILAGYDALALRYVKHPLPLRKTAVVSFLAFAFSNTIGLAGLGGGAVRYRLYSSWGLPGIDIARVIAFCSLTFWLGFLALGGVAFLVSPPALPESLLLTPFLVRMIGLLFLLVVGGYLLLNLTRKKPIRVRRFDFPLPPFRLSLLQFLVSACDWLLAGSVLYALLPSAPSLSFMHFLPFYLMAQTIALASHVPGGLGVFESLMLLMLAPGLPSEQVLAALLVFRVLYFLLPFAAATTVLASLEAVSHGDRVRRATISVGRDVVAMIPNLMAVTVFAGGTILLLSASTPEVPGRLAFLSRILPLHVLETSHFLSSLVGLALLLLARGLQRRLDAAYYLSALFLAFGVILSLLKGFGVEEAALLAGMLLVLLPCRRQFYRRSSLISEPFTAGWTLAVASAVLFSFWLGFFVHRHVEYSSELWWQFTLRGDAPRFLRAATGVMVAGAVLALYRLLRTARPVAPGQGPADLDAVREVVSRATSAGAHLALVGDKSFLFSPGRDAFIMYATQGRSRIAMGDPVGPPGACVELIRRFRDDCRRQELWPVFYEVTPDDLPQYLDAGFTLSKMGEEGRVPLGDFSLEGSSRKGMRRVTSHLERQGGVFEIVPAESLPPILPRLRTISDKWLAAKSAREKRFSLGFFNEPYLRQTPAAIIRQNNEIRAFATLWLSGGKEELSIDLMRYEPDTLDDTMEYLFIRLMLWGQEQGYRWFNLGMAPLAGMEDGDHAPLWHRMGSFLYRHGEHFYNFQGLRAFKDRFDPVWRPMYLASPGGFGLPVILANIATLISGGPKGIVSR